MSACPWDGLEESMDSCTCGTGDDDHLFIEQMTPDTLAMLERAMVSGANYIDLDDEAD